MRVGWVLAAVLAMAVPGAQADEAAPSPHPAEIIADLRAGSYLPTDCEKAFARFWREFHAAGPQGLVPWPAAWDGEAYLGFGNLDAAPLLADAVTRCAADTDLPGAAVVQALFERERAKRDRQRALEHTARSVTGY